MYRFCAEHGIVHERCGKLVVASDESELPALAELHRRGIANGLTDVRRLSAEEFREHEPHVIGIAGLLVPQTGIVNYRQVTQRYAEVVRSAGGDVRTSARVIGISTRADEITLETTIGEIHCRGLVNCGGLQSDRIAALAGMKPDVQIVPFRGEYYKLSPQAWLLVRNLIYPVPNPAFPFLGVHFTRMAAGGVEAGPNAVLALARHGYSWRDVCVRDLLETARFPGFWRMAGKYWRNGLGEMHRSLSRKAFLRALQRLVPEVRMEHLRPGGAGVRAGAGSQRCAGRRFPHPDRAANGPCPQRPFARGHRLDQHRPVHCRCGASGAGVIIVAEPSRLCALPRQRRDAAATLCRQCPHWRASSCRPWRLLRIVATAVRQTASQPIPATIAARISLK